MPGSLTNREAYEAEQGSFVSCRLAAKSACQSGNALRSHVSLVLPLHAVRTHAYAGPQTPRPFSTERAVLMKRPAGIKSCSTGSVLVVPS